MASAGKVLGMLCPDSEWSIIGDKYEDINWYGKKPIITKDEFEAGFAEYDAWKYEQEAAQATAKAALLKKLGITAEEAQLLLGGN